MVYAIITILSIIILLMYQEKNKEVDRLDKRIAELEHNIFITHSNIWKAIERKDNYVEVESKVVEVPPSKL